MPLNLEQVALYVNAHIGTFHNARLEGLKKLKLIGLLKRKNPYLFRAKNLAPTTLVSSLLDAFLSSSEEKHFGDFLEALAIFVLQQTSDGVKSGVTGADLEFARDGVRYVVSIKSGPNWGNSSQYKALKANFKTAVRVLKQAKNIGEVQPVLGICYGATAPVNNGEYLKLTGQAFWHFLSGSEQLYIDLIEPVGFEAKRHNEEYDQERTKLYTRFTREFLIDYCKDDEINWNKLLQLNSKSGILKTNDAE
jgi:Type II restriction endonuclease EcoO109I